MRIHWIVMSLIGLSGFAGAEPLSFNAALELAEQQSPALSAQNASVEAARSSAVAAGALPDPKVFFGVQNLPISGSDGWSMNQDFMTMQTIGLMQDVPNADKRRAQAAEAAAAIDEARGERGIESLKIRREAASAWINRYYIERRIAVFDDLDQENRILLAAVRAQVAAGRGQPADIIAVKQETAQLADRRDDLIRDQNKAKAELKRLIGAEAEEPLAGAPPVLNIDPARLHQHLHHHPELEIFGSMTRKAEAAVQEAEATKKSDWGVAVAYERRAPLYSDMVSVQFTVDLPVFSKTRQDPQIAAKSEELDKIAAERETMLRDHTAELESDLADYAALNRQFERMNQTELPLSRQKYQLQLDSYRAGKGAIGDVTSARQQWIEQQLKAIDLESQQEQAAAKLHFAYGETAQ